MPFTMAFHYRHYRHSKAENNPPKKTRYDRRSRQVRALEGREQPLGENWHQAETKLENRCATHWRMDGLAQSQVRC